MRHMGFFAGTNFHRNTSRLSRIFVVLISMPLASLTTIYTLILNFHGFYFAVVGRSAKTVNESLHHKVEVIITIVMY